MRRDRPQGPGAQGELSRVKLDVGECDTAENDEALMGLRHGARRGIWLGRLYLALRPDVEVGAGRHGHRLYHLCAAADRWWGDLRYVGARPDSCVYRRER